MRQKAYWCGTADIKHNLDIFPSFSYDETLLIKQVFDDCSVSVNEFYTLCCICFAIFLNNCMNLVVQQNREEQLWFCGQLLFRYSCLSVLFILISIFTTICTADLYDFLLFTQRMQVSALKLDKRYYFVSHRLYIYIRMPKEQHIIHNTGVKYS